MNHLVKIEDYTKKIHFVNLNHVINITISDFKENVWKMHLTNGHTISIDGKNLPLELKNKLS